MGMIQFVGNHDDLSTDKGYQFKFYCDKCRNGYMSRFAPSKVGIAGSVLRAAGSMFGGILGSASYGSYDLQRMVGGPEHDSALRSAVEEGKNYFKQCTRCGKWVCPEACWNAQANLCEDCAPNYKEETAAAQARAKADAMRSQVQLKAQQMDYASGINMDADHFIRADDPGVRPSSTPVCAHCGSDIMANAKFCPQCGKPNAAKQRSRCGQCSFQMDGAAKFCPECGGAMTQV